MRLLTLSALMLLVCFNTGCSSDSKREEMKSPCVGAEGSPCEHRPINNWWLS